MFTDFEQAIRYKPLSWLAWAVVHEAFGLNPFGYHLANVLLHCANTVLLFFLLRRLLKCGIRNAEYGIRNGERAVAECLRVARHAALGCASAARRAGRVGDGFALSPRAVLRTGGHAALPAFARPGGGDVRTPPRLLAVRRRVRAGRAVVSHRARLRRRAGGAGLLPAAAVQTRRLREPRGCRRAEGLVRESPISSALRGPCRGHGLRPLLRHRRLVQADEPRGVHHGGTRDAGF